MPIYMEVRTREGLQIEGPVTDAGFERDFLLVSWSFDAAKDTLSIIKETDDKSPWFYRASGAGTMLDIKLTAVRDGVDRSDSFKLQLSGAVVSSVTIGSSRTADKPMDQISFSYEKLSWAFGGDDAPRGSVDKDQYYWGGPDG